jgi:hypothetical protein
VGNTELLATKKVVTVTQAAVFIYYVGGGFFHHMCCTDLIAVGAGRFSVDALLERFGII